MAADKKLQIIEAAIKLFAEKGFHATSIQEIADAAGTAKGSVYLYFKSKDELLLTIFKSNFDMMDAEIRGAGVDCTDPQERFREQLRVQVEKFLKFRDFIKMMLQEQYLHQNEDVQKVIFRYQIQSFTWLHESILEIYGEPLRPWAVDGTQLFQSILNTYLALMVMYNRTIEVEKLIQFLLDRLEDLAEGFIRRQPEPLTTQEMLREVVASFPLQEQPSLAECKEQLVQQLGLMKDTITSLLLDKDVTEDLLGAVQVLQEELDKPEPKRVIVHGMLTVLQQSSRAELKKPLKQLQVAVAAVLDASACQLSAAPGVEGAE